MPIFWHPRVFGRSRYLTHHFIETKCQEFEGLRAEIEVLEGEAGFSGEAELTSELKSD